MSIRAFIAATISQQSAYALGDIAATLSYQDKSHAVRWTDQQNYHLTLAFLAYQDMQTLHSLAERLDEIIPWQGLQLDSKRLSPFPESKPKLIAALIAPNAELNLLQKNCIQACHQCGIKLSKQKYVPHITLGRFRHRHNPYLGTITGQLDIQIEVNEVVLYESHLRQEGAEYDALYRFPMSATDYEIEMQNDDI